MRLYSLVLGLMIALSAFLYSGNTVFAAGGTFGTGSGTSNDPYVVDDCLDLQAIDTHSSSYFILEEDIDCSETATDEETWGTDGFDPNNSFTGSLDGQGHTVDGVFFNRSFSGYNGIFRTITDATIQNIGFTNVDMTVDESTYLGGIAGVSNSSTLIKVYVTGTITHYGSDDSSGTVGGLVGVSAEDDIADSYSLAEIIASSDVDATTEYGGGIAGGAIGSFITNVYAAGSVSNPAIGADAAAVGGLIGNDTSSELENSFWDTEATGQATTSGEGTGKTTAQMKTRDTFTDAGWDFVNVWRIAGETNEGYPYHYYAPATSGSQEIPEIVAPGITILSPNGGEHVLPGAEQIISYVLEGNIIYVNIRASYDNGSSWDLLAGHIMGTGSYLWTIPEIQTSSALVKVEITDLATVVLEDVSDAPFAIGEEIVLEDEIKELNTPEEVQDPEWPSEAISPYDGDMESVSTVILGTYIRGEHFNTVYYIDDTFVRHPFLNEQIFTTYESSFENVRWVTDATLSLMKLGSPMLPNPGTTLVKWESMDSVHATFEGEGVTRGVVRKLLNEAVAHTLVGAGWAEYVIDIPIALWHSYIAHEDITNQDTDLIDVTKLRKRADLIVSQ